MKLSIRKVLSCLLVVFSLLSVRSLVVGGAMLHSTVEGQVVAVNEYKDHTVRVTVQNHAFPNESHDVVIRASTKIYRDGHPGKLLSANILRKGDMVRANGGVNTFGNRIVADNIIILKK